MSAPLSAREKMINHLIELLHDDSTKSVDELRDMWEAYRAQAGFVVEQQHSDSDGKVDIEPSVKREVGNKSKLGTSGSVNSSDPESKKQRT
jgi:hypothetical protein